MHRLQCNVMHVCIYVYMMIFLTVQYSTTQYATYGVSRLGSLGNIEALRTLSSPIITYGIKSKNGITMIIIIVIVIISITTTYVPTYLPTYLPHTYLPTYLLIYLPTYLPK